MGRAIALKDAESTQIMLHVGPERLDELPEDILKELGLLLSLRGDANITKSFTDRGLPQELVKGHTPPGEAR